MLFLIDSWVKHKKMYLLCTVIRLLMYCCNAHFLLIFTFNCDRDSSNTFSWIYRGIFCSFTLNLELNCLSQAFSISGLGHTNTKSCPSVWPCLPVSLPSSRRLLSLPWGSRPCVFYIIPATGSSWRSREICCVRTGNWDKNKLFSLQSISHLGMELDYVTILVHLTNEHAQSMLHCLTLFRQQSAAPLKLFQRLLDNMASSSVVVTCGLMHMRPLWHWLQSRVPWKAWHTGTRRTFTPHCFAS